MRVWFPAIRAHSGADVYTERLVSGLHASGIDSEITWFPSCYEFFPELMRRHIPVKNFDLIHANSWNASVFIGMKVPVVTTVHHLVHDPAYRPYRSMFQAAYHRINIYCREKAALAKCDAVITVSNYTASVVASRFKRESTVIPNWVDTDKYRPAVSNAENSKFVIFIAGNSSRRKGSDLLPEFALKLGPNFEIRVTGGLRQQSFQKMNVDNVTMLGRLSEDQLIKEYQTCDAVVSLSRYEGFGYTALEAMACGKPFLGFDTSGISEVVGMSGAGILCGVDDLNALVRNCKRLSDSKGVASEMGQFGRNRALEFYSGAGSIGKLIECYEDVLRQHNFDGLYKNEH